MWGGAQDSAFQNSTGAIWVGDQSASKSGEWYQIQMLGTRRKWSPPALKQLSWGPNIHHSQNGHKHWETPQVESTTLAETEIRKGTHIVRHSFLGKDGPKQKHDESHAFLSTTGSNIHYWKYSWKYLSTVITTRNLFYFLTNPYEMSKWETNSKGSLFKETISLCGFTMEKKKKGRL